MLDCLPFVYSAMYVCDGAACGKRDKPLFLSTRMACEHSYRLLSNPIIHLAISHTLMFVLLYTLTTIALICSVEVPGTTAM